MAATTIQLSIASNIDSKRRMNYAHGTWCMDIGGVMLGFGS